MARAVEISMGGYFEARAIVFVGIAEVVRGRNCKANAVPAVLFPLFGRCKASFIWSVATGSVAAGCWTQGRREVRGRCSAARFVVRVFLLAFVVGLHALCNAVKILRDRTQFLWFVYGWGGFFGRGDLIFEGLVF